MFKAVAPEPLLVDPEGSLLIESGATSIILTRIGRIGACYVFTMQAIKWSKHPFIKYFLNLSEPTFQYGQSRSRSCRGWRNCVAAVAEGPGLGEATRNLNPPGQPYPAGPTAAAGTSRCSAAPAPRPHRGPSDRAQRPADPRAGRRTPTRQAVPARHGGRAAQAVARPGPGGPRRPSPPLLLDEEGRQAPLHRVHPPPRPGTLPRAGAAALRRLGRPGGRRPAPLPLTRCRLASAPPRRRCRRRKPSGR